TGDIMFSDTFQNNGTFDVGQGTATSTGHATSTGTIWNGSGMYEVVADFVDNGTYNGQTGTLKAVNTANQRLGGTSASTNFYNLAVNKTSGTVTLNGNVTSTGAFTLTDGTFAVGNNRFAASGSYTNSDTVTIGASGSIVYGVDLVDFVDSDGTGVASYATPASIYVRVTDPDRNLLAASAETMTVTVSMNSGAGGDSETFTLTETAVASGIFQNSAITLANSSVASLGNGQVEITQTGTMTISYADTIDASDSSSTTVTATFVAVTAAASSGGGGGSTGGGGGYIPSPTSAADAATAERLDYFDGIGFSQHNLVKLPDDGNVATQEDSAVYYLGSDGRRHAFPNSKSYFTWYAGFSGVKTISPTDIAGIPLGANVTYKPGEKMVKFITDPKTYAVDKGGSLRWVTTEDLATQLYGLSWNTMIDDINDAFYTNYSFGLDISVSSDFNPTEVEATVSFPSDSM
ncbi:MAG: hypothetical protein NUV81_01770, partial [bacterium]|nr:hypothetical protein [bacterium]